MALEALKGITEIGGFKVTRNGGDDFIFIKDDENAIAFKIQNGPIKEVGVNGCQVDTLIHAAKMIIEGLNKKVPCTQNTLAIDFLYKALTVLELRKLDRESRGVESQNNKGE